MSTLHRSRSNRYRKDRALKQLCRTEEHCADIPPEALSLHYIPNSNIIQFFESLDVRLDLFYKLLWCHVLTCELLRLKYHMYTEEAKNVFFERLRGVFFRNQAKERALKYLEQWGARFWEDTEVRVKEFTQKLETELEAAGSVSINPLAANIEAARRLTEEQRAELVARAKEVVNKVQIRDLNNVITLLKDDIFTNMQQRYFLIIDRLDEDWVDNTVRYRLIKALIEAVRSFRGITGVKIVFALQTDLLQRVLNETQTAGFQAEKYESMYLQMRWTKEDLCKLINHRVSYMFKRQYKKGAVGALDIPPKNQIEQGTGMDYMIQRSLMRPRDLIKFFNECIVQAEGKSQMKVHDIKAAEANYSRERLNSIYDEWKADFPMLSAYVRCVRNKPPIFRIGEIVEADVEELVCAILAKPEAQERLDPVRGAAENYCAGGELDQVRIELVRVLYQVSLLGVKLEAHQRWQWSHLDDATISDGILSSDVPVAIHKMFWRVLGVG